MLLSQFLYIRSLGTCDALLTLSCHLQVALDRTWRGRLFQLYFSAAFDGVSDCCMLHKLRFIGVGRQFWSIVLKFLSDSRQCVRLDCKVS